MTKKTRMYIIVIAAAAALFIPFRIIPTFLPLRTVSDQIRIESGRYESITVKTVEPAVTVKPADGDTAEFTLKGYSNRSYRVDVISKGSQLEVEVKRRMPAWMSWGTRTRNLTLEIALPEWFAESAEFRTVSGAVKIEEIKIPSLSAGTVSGAIQIHSVESKEIHGKSVSGAVSVSSNNASWYNMQTTSGAVRLDASHGELQVKSVSGGIAASLGEVLQPIDITSVSGAVRLEVPQDADISVSLSSVTGSLRSEHSLDQHSSGDRFITGRLGAGTHNVTLKTTSGSISLR